MSRPLWNLQCPHCERAYRLPEGTVKRDQTHKPSLKCAGCRKRFSWLRGVSTVYASQRLEQMRSMASLIPGWEWVSCCDPSVRPSHQRLHGKVFPLDCKRYPPTDDTCRCTMIPVDKDRGTEVLSGKKLQAALRLIEAGDAEASWFGDEEE